MKKNKFLIAIVAIAFTACNSSKTEDTKPEEKKSAAKITTVSITADQFKTIGIETAKVEMRNLSTTIKTNGKLTLPPQNKADVSVAAGGIVKEIKVVEGDFVKKGQTLALIQSAEFLQTQQEYLENAAMLPSIEQEYKRQQSLQKDSINSKKIFQQAEANYNSTVSKQKSLTAKLSYFGVNAENLSNISPLFALTSPIDGYIHQIEISTGSFAEPNKALMDIVDNRFLHLDLTIFEKDIFKVKEGQKVFFTYANTDLKNQTNIASIYALDKAFLENQQAIIVHAKLDKPNTNLLPGMYVNANIQVDNYQTPSVPDEAVVSEGEDHFIFVVDAKEKGDSSYIYRRVQVTAGAADGGFTEIKAIDELKPDELIVTKGAFSLLSEMTKGEAEEE